MNDLLEKMPSVYEGGEDYFKPGEGFANEEYTRFNYNTANPHTAENMRNFYEDFHNLQRSIYPNRHWVSERPATRPR